MPGVRYILPCQIFVGFFLLLLVSLPIPIIKTISIFNVEGKHSLSFFGPGVSGGARLGVWGYCTSDINASIIGLNVWSRNSYCSGSMIGYEFTRIDNRLLSLLGIDKHRNNISRGLTFILALHPIACGLALIALAFALGSLYRPLRPMSLMTLVFSVLAAMVATFAFLIDVALATFAKVKSSDATNGNVKVTYGIAPWMVLGAMVALWAVPVGICGIPIGGMGGKQQ